MLRVVYVPESYDSSLGQELAIKHQIPIVHGLCSLIESVEFDREEIQVLHIPEYKKGGQSAQSIRCNFVMSIRYDDEYKDLSNANCILQFNYSDSDEKIIINPSVKEKHLLIFNIRPTDPGAINYDIIVDDEIVYSNMFGVL